MLIHNLKQDRVETNIYLSKSLQGTHTKHTHIHYSHEATINVLNIYEHRREVTRFTSLKDEIEIYIEIST